MDRIIEVKVNGSHLAKDNGYAGVQYESNATVLRIEFDEGWDRAAKTVTFWNALGKNPVKRTLTADRLENLTVSARVYLCPIPGEAMTEAGRMEFAIDGYADGKHQRSVSDKLRVDPAPYAADAGYPSDPTPSQAEQLQVQIDTILQNISTEAARAVSGAAQAANSESVASAGASSAALSASNAAASAQVASEARIAAEKAASMAKTVVGGDYVGPGYVDNAIAVALSNIPTPDISRQIAMHNDSVAAHSDIRTAVNGKVSKSGDTINGSLTIDGALTVKRSGSDRIARTVVHNNAAKEVDFQNYISDANYIALRMATEETGVGDAVKVVQMSNGSFAAFPVLHTGNKEKIFTFGTSDLTAGSSPLGTGQLYFVYE